MCGKSAPETFQEILRRLRSAGEMLLVTHARPDGDAVGCVAALALAARAAGKTAHVLIPDEIPGHYQFLFRTESAPQSSSAKSSPQKAFRGLSLSEVAGANRFPELAEEADLIVVLDTCAFSQLDGLEKEIRKHRDKIVVIDHHATADDVGAVRWIDPGAAAAGVMVAEIIEALGWPIAPAAEALAVAITTDTGWLRFPNTDARCLRAMARVLEAGVRTDTLYARLYQSDRPERLRLLERMLLSLELHCGDRLAVMTLRKSDFEQTGARQDETENLINEALRVGSVEAVVLLVETPDCIRASLRSRELVDVAAVAQRFGGGGHARAAGLRAKEDLETVRNRVTAALADEIDKIFSKPAP